MCAKLLQSCPILCDPMDYSLPSFSVHGIFQARILEWVAMPSSKGSSWPRNQTRVSYISCIGRCVCVSVCVCVCVCVFFFTTSAISQQIFDCCILPGHWRWRIVLTALFFVLLYSDHLTYQIPASSLIFRDISAVLELLHFIIVCDAELWTSPSLVYSSGFSRETEPMECICEYMYVSLCVYYIYIHM